MNQQNVPFKQMETWSESNYGYSYVIVTRNTLSILAFAVFHVSPGKHHQISECCKALRICLPWLLKDKYGMDDG